jgi:glycosyltransferase involved in cell wall biosynthesis
MSPKDMDKLSKLPAPDHVPIRFVSIGRALHWKGFYLGLKAFAQADLDGAEYWIRSSGQGQENLKRLAQNLGIAEQVRFWDKLPSLEDVYNKVLGHGDVLVHPALHEAFGNVVLEAMAAGRPVICLDLGGPAVQVTEETGFKVPAVVPEQAVSDLAAAMRRLSEDPGLRVRMGEAARRRAAKHFGWHKRSAWIAERYREYGPDKQSTNNF